MLQGVLTLPHSFTPRRFKFGVVALKDVVFKGLLCESY